MNTPQYPSDLRQWLVLHRISCSSAAVVDILKAFGNLGDILKCSPQNFAAAGLRPLCWDWWQRIKHGFSDRRAIEQAKQDEAWLKNHGIHVIPYGSEGYPDLLTEIHSPPILLYLRGNPATLHLPQVAIVGSRRPTATGKDNAHQFAHYLASGGFTITSGLALGIDGASHEGAIAGGGTTIGVMATGIDQIYPRRHKPLAERICHHGALISEFPLGFKPLREHFPQRNRIISGLSLGVLVVEAAVQSGSLITARQAMEQNREVFAIPGSIHNPLSKGCHCLIRDGVTLVESADDILAELGGALQGLCVANCIADVAADVSNKQIKKPEPGDLLSRHEKQVLKQLGHDPASFDTLLARTQLSTAELSAVLIQLEIVSMIEFTAGCYSVRGATA